MLVSQKKSALYLKSLLKQLEIQKIVICPGSRNLPLIISFANDPYFEIISVIDERSAGFIALGIAKAEHKPAAIITTSGSAAINLAPAIAEAYYQHIPLIALTADRPQQLINKGENQTIIQIGLFQNFIDHSFSLDENISLQEFESFAQKLYAATHIANKIGPIHINLPYSESLSITQNLIGEFNFNNIFKVKNINIDNFKLDNLNCKNIIVYLSAHSIDSELNRILTQGIEEEKWLVISEISSGFSHPKAIYTIDLILKAKQISQTPDLLITIGEVMLSKSFRKYIGSLTRIKHIDISFKSRNWNTLSKHYQNITINNYSELNSLVHSLMLANKTYIEEWQAASNYFNTLKNNYLSIPTYKEFYLVNQLIEGVESQSVIYWGNSSAIRYANWGNWANRSDVIHLANRGVSGIEGVLSSAIGYQISRKIEHFYCILGDISLLYEQNALQSIQWIENIKIIVLNNHGGKIFNNIHATDDLGEMKSLITPQYYNLEHICKSFDLEYFKVNDLNSFTDTVNLLKSKKGRIMLEIDLPKNSHTQWGEFFDNLT